MSARASGRALQLMKLVEQYGGVKSACALNKSWSRRAADLYNRINALAQEMGDDAERYTWAARHMSIDDIGDESAVYGLVVNSEGMEEEAARAKCWSVAEYRDKKPSVEDAVDAAMKDMKA